MYYYFSTNGQNVFQLRRSDTDNKLWQYNVQANVWPVVHSVWVVIVYMWLPLNIFFEYPKEGIDDREKVFPAVPGWHAPFGRKVVM